MSENKESKDTKISFIESPEQLRSPLAVSSPVARTKNNRYLHIGGESNVQPSKNQPLEEKIEHHVQCSTCNPQTKFASNYVSTTKYNVISFLPVNLFEQFRKKANLYFLIVAIISLTPLSPKTPIVSVAPLVFVLSVSAIKEAIEDYYRYKMDKEMNNKQVKVWRGKQFQDVKWQDIVVGDIVYIVDGAQFPADIVMLKSSGSQGTCTIETSNLDGETNLKTKQAVPETYNIQGDWKSFPSEFPASIIESSPPDKGLGTSSWKGNITMTQNPGNRIALGMNQLLLRGCRLRNTKWVIGFVLFTGQDTKIMLNSKSVEFKRSNVDKIVDRALYMLFALEGCLCSAGAILNYLWINQFGNIHWYLPYRYEKTDIREEAGLSWFTYLVLLDILIPISLYVSMELVKFSQAWLISNDNLMYYEKTNTPPRARTSNLNEELGQVSYIFSDKTGTLTNNVMQFNRCSIAGTCYGDDSKTGGLNKLPLPGGIPSPEDSFPFCDSRILTKLSESGKESEDINEFLTLLCTCHTVLPAFSGCEYEHRHGEAGCIGAIEYQASSPDEKALVVAAKHCHYYFYHLEPKEFTINKINVNGLLCYCNIKGKVVQFQILEILRFTSTRARMSVILLDPRDGRIKIYCKGSDTKIYDKLTEESKRQTWKTTNKHIMEFSEKGLRTLCCAYAIIEREAFVKWYLLHKEATSSVDFREKNVRRSNKRIEKNLKLLGATAIEDKLQEGVPETIQKLADAGIKIWMLTGDKVETAVNIGKSCSLITPSMLKKKEIRLTVDESMSDDQAKNETFKILDTASEILKDTAECSEDQAIIVSGRSLTFIFPSKEHSKSRVKQDTPEEEKRRIQFLDVCRKCKAVICCRVSPHQKAEIVSLIKEKVQGSITLAIGDGANDVSMIKSAHVGIGISGLEGLQAVMASDYAIAQFKYLERLLLVHGAWSYRRISLLILYSFYKNVTISFTQVWFAFYCGFSAQMYYDPYAGSAYNMVPTAFPVMFASVFNRDVQAENLLKYPFLYKSGQQNKSFNLLLLCLNIFEAIVQSIILFSCSMIVFADVSVRDGTVNDVWITSTAMYSFLIVLVNVRIGLDTTTWTWISHLFIYLSILSWFVLVYAYSGIYAIASYLTPNMYYVAVRLFQMPIFWLCLIFVPVVCIVPEIIVRYVRQNYFPTYLDTVAQHEWKSKKTKQNSSVSLISHLPPPSPQFQDNKLHDNRAAPTDSMLWWWC